VSRSSIAFAALAAPALLLCALPTHCEAGEPWPAESRAAAVDIGEDLDGGEPSGAAWHKGLERLFIVDDQGNVVHMNADGSDPVQIDGLPADIEAAVAVPGDDEHIYVGLENPPGLLRVRIDDGETDGQWDLPNMSVGTPSKRLEGLAFLPDAHASAIRTAEDEPYNGGSGSAFGSGGLILAAHQGNGRIYIYDVDFTSTDAATFINTYGPFSDGNDTLTDLSGLDFHAGSAMVYALWDNPIDGSEQGRLAVLDPAQELAAITIWNTATDSFGEEGFALLDDGFADGTSRAVIAEDEASDHSVYLYSQFAVPGLPSCGDTNGDMATTATDALMILRAAVGSLACELCHCDVDGGGATTAVDALRALNIAVGQPLGLLCPACSA
jgi:hypothetical protein